MSAWEYKVVAAPRAAGRHKGVKGREAQFARTMEEALRAEAVDGWEFQRAETLPCEEKTGMFGGRESILRCVLIFRRPRAGAFAAAQAGATPVAEDGPSLFAQSGEPAVATIPLGPAER